MRINSFFKDIITSSVGKGLVAGLCIVGNLVATVQAATTPACQPNGYVLGFFNGVFNSRADAIVGLQALRNNLNKQTYNGADVRPMLFYNHTGCGGAGTSCAEDIAEVFIQKGLEADPTGTISKRFEFYWEAMSSIETNFFDQVGTLITNLKLSAVSNPIFPSVTRKVIAGWSWILSNPPLDADYVAQRAALNAVASKGQMMLLVAHSQGNLFMNHAFDYIKPLAATNGVAAVHIAPASSSLRGDWRLSASDVVINGLGVLLGAGTVPPVNLNLDFSFNDISGHELIATYLDKSRSGYPTINKMMTNALGGLARPSVCGYSLYGSKFSLNVQNPLGNVVSTTVSGIVTPNGFYNVSSIGNSYGIIPQNITIKSNQIEVDYTSYARAAYSSFNGYVFTFDPETVKISTCELDSVSTYTSAEVGVVCNANQVFINGSGIQSTPTDRIIVNLGLIAP